MPKSLGFFFSNALFFEVTTTRKRETDEETKKTMSLHNELAQLFAMHPERHVQK